MLSCRNEAIELIERELVRTRTLRTRNEPHATRGIESTEERKTEHPVQERDYCPRAVQTEFVCLGGAQKLEGE